MDVTTQEAIDHVRKALDEAVKHIIGEPMELPIKGEFPDGMKWELRETDSDAEAKLVVQLPMPLTRVTITVETDATD